MEWHTGFVNLHTSKPCEYTSAANQNGSSDHCFYSTLTPLSLSSQIQQRDKRWQAMRFSNCCEAPWTQACAGFPQIPQQLPWIGANHAWLWRLPWHVFTAGLYQWSNSPSKILSFKTNLFSHASSLCGDIFAIWRIILGLIAQHTHMPGPWPTANTFLQKHHKSAKYPQSEAAWGHRMIRAPTGQGHHPKAWLMLFS